MKINMLMLLAFILVLGACGNKASENEGDTVVLKKNQEVEAPSTIAQKMSYVMGMDAGRNFRHIDSNGLDMVYFYAGLIHAMKDKALLVSDAERVMIIQEFSKLVSERQIAEFDKNALWRDSMAVVFSKTTPKFLDSYKNSSGVKTTASGIMYKVKKEGSGKSPDNNSIVKMNFRAKLTNGHEFDNTYDRGRPVELPVAALMAGWKEGMMLMKEGSHYEICVPPIMAFGTEGAAPKIPGNAAIIFDVELIEVKEGGNVPPPPLPPPSH